MDKNILVIGNGFDIYHGLKTKYYDFVQYTKLVIEEQPTMCVKIEDDEKERIYEKIINSCKSNLFITYFQEVAKENQGWIDCEREIEIICNIFNKILNIDKAVDGSGVLNSNIIMINELRMLEYAKNYINYTDRKMMGQEWWSINSKYIHLYKIINKELMIKDLNEDLNELIEVFHYYLLNEVVNKTIDIRSEQIKNVEFSYAVNFNYTNTFKLYNIDPSNVCYIHGSVEAGANSMVLGTRDIENGNHDFIYFKKYFQRIRKKTELLDSNKFKRDEAGMYRNEKEKQQFFDRNRIISYFFGHSLSLTDGDMIRDIEGLSDKLIIYYYDEKDHEQKMINMIDVFGKEKALQLIYGGKADFVKLETAEMVE